MEFRCFMDSEQRSHENKRYREHVQPVSVKHLHLHYSLRELWRLPDLLRLGDVVLKYTPDRPGLYLHLGAIYHTIVIGLSTSQFSGHNTPQIASRSVPKSTKQTLPS